MLNWIVSHSLRFRGVVITLAVAVIGYGTFTASRTKLDVFPEFAPPMVVIQTEAPGLSPEQVEALVTRPLETALNGTPQLASIRSESIQGLSAITLTFDERADIYRVRQLANERLSEATSWFPARAWRWCWALFRRSAQPWNCARLRTGRSGPVF
jgi:Cu/Ag efflux pump CusA